MPLKTVVSVICLAGIAWVSAAIAQPVPLAGLTWRVQSLMGERVPDGIEVTLAFLPEGRIAGRSGCNRFTGTATVGTGVLKVGPVAGTRMACPEPAAGLETRFLALLQAAESWAAPSSGQLVIRTADGRDIVALAQ